MSKQNLLAFWKQGTPLTEAYANPSEETIKDEYERLLNAGQPSGDQPTIGAGLQTVLDVTQSLAYHGAELRAVKLSQQALLEELLTEELIGLGFESPITVSGVPQIIPPHVWPSRADEINWYESSFETHGILFLKIRVIKTATIDNKSLLPNSKVEDKATGRPSIRDAIREAYEHLEQTSQIDHSKSLKSHIELIQENVRSLCPEIEGTKGMKYEVIRLTIGERFKADRSNL